MNTIAASVDMLPDMLAGLPDDEFDQAITVIHAMTEATGDLIDHDTQQIRILDALNTGLARQLAASDNDPGAA